MKPIPLTFNKSAPTVSHLPDDHGREIIMAGYSNVGKSSVINAIANIKDLAKKSRTPGRTQLFNVFQVSDDKRILDLPGYGFAKVPAKTQAAWAEQMQHYLASRKCLTGLMLITDIRRDTRPIDLDLIAWCQDNNIPFSIVLNKADKLSKNKACAVKNKLLSTLSVTKEQVIICSCLKKTGIDVIISQLNMWLNNDE